MRNLCLTIAYDGSAYAGWQYQPQDPTVQGTIEEVLQRMTQQPCRLRAAGRTDAGVHAAGQVATFRTDSAIACQRFHRGLNALLPPDITVLEVRDVPSEFDPRRHCRGKHYRYTIWNERVVPPHARRNSYHCYGRLDLAAMADAAQRLVGRHDFAAFRAADCDRENTTRTLYRCTVGTAGARIRIDIEGTAFLKNMVRIIAGTIVAVGRARIASRSMHELLVRRDRSVAGPTLPAHGLCLMRVFL